MRNFLFAALAAVALCGAGLGGALGQSSGDGRKLSDDDKNRWMFVENKSNLTAAYIYIIPSIDDCCWSRDLLGRDPQGRDIVIKPPDPKTEEKETWLVNFDDGRRNCVFDIRVVDLDRDWEWHFDWVDVCKRAKITLERGEETKHRVKIENKSNYDAYFIYSIPSKRDCCWSRDLLGKNIIPKGKELVVDFDMGDGECEFDIRVTSKADNKEWNFDEINVCQTPEITLK